MLAFAIALSLVTGVAFGLAPALKATKVELLSTLRDEGLQPIDHRRLTLKNALIVVQVAVSVLLLGGTSIFLQAGAARAHRVGYAVDGVAMLETDVRFAGYSANAATTVYDELLRRITAIPGVESAALLRGLPMGATGVPIVVDGAGHRVRKWPQRSMICGRTGLLRNAAHPARVGPRIRRTRPRGHAARRRDHRDDGAAVLWRRQRRRPAIPVGGRSGLLDGGDRRRARYWHRQTLPTTSSIRSRRPFYRSYTQSGASADDGRRANIA